MYMYIDEYWSLEDNGFKPAKRFNSLNAKCIYTCENYLPHHSCSAVCYVVLINTIVDTIVDAWKYNTDMHVTP